MSRLKVDRIETTDAGSLKIAPSVTIQNSAGVDRVIINGNGNGNLTVTCPIEVGTEMASRSAGQIGQVLTSQGRNYAPLWKSVAELPLFNEFPIGGIVMWSGSSNTIPSGYKLCDGTQYGTVKTPNLTERFILGASTSNVVNTTGGTKDAVVVAHTHSYTGYRGGGDGGGQVYDAFYSNQDGVLVTNGTEYTSSSAGESGVGKNLPPYYALFYIMRVS